MYVPLVTLRLRWYARTSGHLLLRHWQWILLACIIVPGIPVVSLFLDGAMLMQASVSPGPDPLQHMLIMTGLEGAAVLWILPQRQAMSGGPFSTWATTLPITHRTQTCVEATLLAAANSPFLLITALAVAGLPDTQHNPYPLCSVLVMLALAAVAQNAVLNRQTRALPGILPGNAALAMGLATPVSPIRWLLLTLAIASAAATLFLSRHVRNPEQRSPNRRKSPFFSAGTALLASRAPALLIQCKTLAEHPGPALLRIIATLALATGAARLISIFSFDSRSPLVLVLAMTANCLLLAGLYRLLYAPRHAMRDYLSALPLPRYYWPMRDILFMLMLNTLPLAILSTPLIIQGHLSLITLAALIAAWQILLALLRWPVIHGGRRSLLCGALLSLVWSGAALAAVSP
ncbi:hypothetical protein [Acetobacter fallax]|nr:hypothetical protein [Acetobacter fallax]